MLKRYSNARVRAEKNISKTTLWPLVFAILLITSVFVFQPSKQANAATASYLNFQARLLTSSGTVVPDGNYHIEFKIYDTVGSGASAQGACSLNSSSDDCWWLETRTTGNLVRVVNGYFNVNLGSVTAFGSSIPWDQQLYLTMNIGGTAGSPSWDGEMLSSGNRITLTGVPYAFAAGKLQSTASGITNSLVFATPSGSNKTLTLPNETGTVCTTAVGGACAASFIQNQNSGQQATSVFWISGTGRSDTSFIAPAFDALSAGALALGGTNATGVTIGNTTNTTSLTLQGTTGATYTVGSNLTTGTISVGGTGQTGTMTLGQSTATNTISIGAAAGASATQTINIGTSSTASSTTNLVLGSTIAGSTTIQSASGLTLTSLGAADTDNVVCRNSSNVISTCSSTFLTSGNTFSQGGNSFSATAVLGTNDANSLSFETQNAVQATIAVGGATTFKNSTDSTAAFQIQNNAGTSNLFVADTTNTRIGIATNAPAYTLQVNGASAGANFVVATTSATAGAIRKLAIAGTGGVSANDVVILTLDGGNLRAITTTTARDNRVYGVAVSTVSAGVNADIAISGNFQVTADTAAVAVGDQLVTSTTTGQVTVDNNATTGILGIALTAKSGGSSGLVGVMIRPANGQYSPVFRNASDSATAFQVQNASGARLLNVDTTGAEVEFGAASTTSGKLTLFNASGSGSISVVPANPGSSNFTLTLPAETGTVCTTAAAGVCSVAGSGFVQLAPSSVQADSTTNNSIFINKTGASGNILNLQNNGSNVFVVGNSGAITASGTYNTNTFNSTTLQFGGASGTVSTSSGSLSIQAATTNTLTLNTTGAGTVNLATANSTTVGIGNTSAALTIEGSSAAAGIAIGNGATNHGIQIGTSSGGSNTISIGSTNAGSTLSLEGGTASNAIAIGNGATAHGIQIGTGAAAQTIAIGSTNTTSTTTINGGTGAGAVSIQAGASGTISLGTANNNTITVGGTGTTGTITIGQANSNNSNTISIGSNIGASGTQTINIGASNTASSTTNVTIGSTIAGSTTLQSAGGVVVTTLGAANTATYLCRNSTNQLATCNTTGAGAAFIQGGNAFGATATLGTTDAQSLNIITAGTIRAGFDQSNNLFLGNGGAGGANTAPTNFTLSATSSSASGTAGGNLSVLSGAGNGSGAGGSLNLTGGAAGATATGGAVNITSGAGGASSGNSGAINIASGNVTSGTAGNVSIDVGTSSSSNGSILVGTAARTQTITVGGTGNAGTITLGQSTASSTINIGSNVGGSATQTINIGTSATASSNTNVTIGSTIAGSTTIQSPTTNINSGTIATNQATLSLFDTAATNVTAFQAATAWSVGATTGGLIVRNANQTFGNAAGSGVFTNNGATYNTTLALGNDVDGGVLGSTAAASVDVYSSISIAQTTAGQTFSLATPTSSTQYGRTVTVSNIGTTAITLGSLTIPNGGSGQYVWSNTNGGASWQTSSVDAILNQNSSDQTANFRISGTGRANTSFTAPLFDAVSGGLSLGTSTATGVTIGGTTNTTSVLLQGASGATYTIGTTNNSGGITIGNSLVNNTVTIGSAAGSGATQAINIGTSNTAGSTTNVTIGSAIAGTTTLQSAGGVVVSTLGAASNTTYLCRNGSNQIATCSTTATGAAFIQGGNAFGATGTLGTTDAQSLNIITAGTIRAGFDQSNNLFLGNGGAGGSATTPNNFTLSATNSSASGTAGANLTAKAGDGNGSGGGGLFTLQGGAAGATGTGGGVSIISGIGGATSGNSGALTIATGNVTSGTAGNISIDVGTSSASSGSILIGTAARTQAITIGNTTGSTAIVLQAGTGGITLGASAGQGQLTNNGSTLNSTLSVSDDADGGVLGGGLTASASVDIYTSISINQTTAGQTISLPTPTASTTYGRILYVSNIGSVSFILGSATMSAGTSATLVWSNTNGGASWQYAGADANGILNQNTADQSANFRISGTGRANTSFITPSVDSISGALAIGGTTATGLTLGNVTNTSTITLQGTTAAAYSVGSNATTGTITVGGSTTTGAITLGQYNSTGTSTINIGAALASAGTQAINIGTGSTGTGNLTLGNTGGGFTTIQSPTINLNAATISTNQAALSVFDTTAATVTAFQAATSLGIGATTGTFTVRNANQTFGNAAGSGVFTNNGATFNTTLSVADDADGGALGGGLAASASVDVYTSISINQTTASQTITLPTPTASTNYGRLLYISNIGSASFVIGGATVSAGTSATLVWSNTNGGASWQFAGADANGILNQNTVDQTANFRISGTGRANTSFITPSVDSISGALAIGGTTATGLTLGNTSNTATITLQGTTGAAYSVGSNLTTGTITVGGSTTTGAITLGQYNSTGTSTINIGAALASAGTQTINIGTGSTGTGNLTLGNTGGGFTTIQSPTINLNGATVSTNATTLSFLDTNAATVTAFQAATSLGIGATTGTFTVRNANQTFGNAAGSGVFTNNGSTLNTTLALSDDNNGGVLGSTAAATVDIYTSISIAQTTASQTFTIATPTASTNYGRLLYISNIGTASFTIGSATISAGATATMVWSNTNGGASWQFAGADAASILNQNSATQTANFRISGTGQVAGIDGLSGAGLALGATNATSLTLGNVTNTATISLQGTTAAAYSVGSNATTGTITLGGNTTTGAITIGQNQTGTTSTVNISSANGTASTQTVEIGGGTSTTSGGKVVNIANGTPGTGTTNTVAIGTAGSTTGTVGVTVGSIAAAAHTTTIQGGNTSAAITLQTAASGSINIGTNNVATKTINIGSVGSTAQATTVNIANTSGNAAQVVSIGSSANTSSTINIESGTGTSAIQIGNGATAHGIQIGSNSGGDNDILIGSTNAGSTVTIEAGTASGAIAIGNGGTSHNIQIGTGADDQHITLGSTNSTSDTTIQGGNGTNAININTASGGTLNVGNGAVANTIQIGNTTGAVAQTINIGNNATASSATTLVMGSLISTSATTIQSGSGGTKVQVGTDSSAAFQLQNSNLASGLTYDSTLTSNVAANGGAEVSGTFSTNWTAQGTSTINRDTTPVADIPSGAASVEAVLGTTSGNGVINNLASNPAVSSTYVVSFTAKLTSGSAFTDLSVRYTPDGGGNNVDCANYSTQTLTAAFVKVSCTITTAGTAVSNPDLIIRQPSAAGVSRTLHIDNLNFSLQSSSSTAASIRLGGPLGQGLTLFTLDNFAAAPWSGTSNTAFGSMYYDTTIGKIQCYQSNGWGSCGVPANQIVTLTPEYSGAVLNGGGTPGVGTMTADFCANGGGLTVNTTLCASGEARNFYKWTSPQATQQVYSIYVTYKLPTNFSNFLDNNTITLTGRTDSTTNGFVTYELFRSTGGAISACGTETTVTTSNNTWQTVSNNGNETSCSYAGGDYVILKVNVKAEDNANVYVENLNFTFTTI